LTEIRGPTPLHYNWLTLISLAIHVESLTETYSLIHQEWVYNCPNSFLSILHNLSAHFFTVFAIISFAPLFNYVISI
jgi:hypothetical protein